MQTFSKGKTEDLKTRLNGEGIGETIYEGRHEYKTELEYKNNKPFGKASVYSGRYEYISGFRQTLIILF